MQFGYTIIYVPHVASSLTFFEQAFGLSRRFLHESGTYGELDTGTTTLAFADHTLGHTNFPGGHVAAHSSGKPLGVEIGLVTPDVPAAHEQAVRSGATELAPPATRPWGQTVSYVRCPDGTLVELCTPILAG
jgi:catechol 2,3-dioxygenase-like lactoylglutathione lyase family enzyme